MALSKYGGIYSKHYIDSFKRGHCHTWDLGVYPNIGDTEIPILLLPWLVRFANKTD